MHKRKAANRGSYGTINTPAGPGLSLFEINGYNKDIDPLKGPSLQ